MKNLLNEQNDGYYYDDIIKMGGLSDEEEDDEDRSGMDDDNILSEWRKQSHDQKYAINGSFRQSSLKKRNIYESFEEGGSPHIKSEAEKRPIRSNQAS